MTNEQIVVPNTYDVIVRLPADVFIERPGLMQRLPRMRQTHAPDHVFEHVDGRNFPIHSWL
jgi:hypothetical protein